MAHGGWGCLDSYELPGQPGARMAWASGLFEGEGCVFSHNGIPGVVVSQTHENVLVNLQEVIGGSIYGPYENGCADGYPRRPIWHLRIRGVQECSEIYARFERFLGDRRRGRFQEVLIGESLGATLRPREALRADCEGIAWAAGLFEAEGCISWSGSP